MTEGHNYREFSCPTITWTFIDIAHCSLALSRSVSGKCVLHLTSKVQTQPSNSERKVSNGEASRNGKLLENMPRRSSNQVITGLGKRSTQIRCWLASSATFHRDYHKSGCWPRLGAASSVFCLFFYQFRSARLRLRLFFFVFCFVCRLCDSA